jgi:arsenite methyltransferase
VEFREGLAEALPLPDGWADVVISNGVINLCVDKAAVITEIRRVLRQGGWLQFADIANGRSVPVEAMRTIDLSTGGIADGLPRAGWQAMLEQAGFVDVQVGPGWDTFGGARGEANARAYEVCGYPFLARTPQASGQPPPRAGRGGGRVGDR